MLVYDDLSKKCQVIFKNFLLLFGSFLSYLVCAPRFKSINSSSLSRKKYDGDNFIPTTRKRLRGQNTLVAIGLIELTEPSDTLNYQLYFKHCVLQSIFHVFLLFIFV